MIELIGVSLIIFAGCRFADLCVLIVTKRVRIEINEEKPESKWLWFGRFVITGWVLFCGIYIL